MRQSGTDLHNSTLESIASEWM